MRKKLLATVLAASMVLAMAPVLPATTTTVASAEDAATTVETVGTPDKTAAWWTAFSSRYKLSGDFEAKFSLTNHSDMANVWNAVNYVFATADATSADQDANYKEYAVIRSDNWGWGGGDNLSLSGDPINYDGGVATAGDDAFKEILKEAKFDTTITRKGDEVTISEVVTSVSDASKSYTRTVTFKASTDDIYMFFVADGSYIEINSVDIKNAAATVTAEQTVGATDKSTGFWKEFSNHYKLTGDFDTTIKFNNYGGAQNFNNYVMIFTNEAAVNEHGQSENYVEHAVIRSDSYSWAVIDGTVTPNVTISNNPITYTTTFGDDWASFLSIMQKASVELNVKRTGTDVTVTATATSLDDATKSYVYTASFTETDQDMYLTLTVDGSYLEVLSVEGAEIIAGPTNNTTPTTPTNPGDEPTTPVTPAKKTMKISKVTAKKNTTKITGTVSVKKATVKVKVGKKAYKKATVNGKNFTFKVAKLKKGTKVTVKATKSGYKAVTKSVKVK